MKARGSLTRTVFVFALGVIAGAGVMYAALRPAPEPAPVVQAPAPEPIDDAPLAPGSGIVNVTLSNGDLDVRGHGLAIDGHHVIVLPLAGFRPATRGSWRGADGRTRPLRRAVAWDFDLGIAVFDAGDASRDGLTLAADDGSLYVGREFTLLSSTGRTDGFVDSPAIASPLGDFRYRIALNGEMPERGAGLLIPGTRTLIGLALAGIGEPTRSGDAIDAGTLRDLIAQRAAAPPLSVEELSSAYLRSYPGLRSLLAAHLGTGRWQDAVTIGDMLLETHPERTDFADREDVVTAHVNLIGAQLDAGGVDEALQTARRAEAQLGRHARLRLQLARSLQRSGDPQAAVEALLDYLERPAGQYAPGVRETLASELRSQLVRLVNDGALPAQASVALLERALQVDGFAGYHRDLGQQYYGLGRYRDAEVQLRRAVELDPGYAQELEYALAESRQRRSTARLIEVPIRAIDNAIFVNVRINGRPELYRFLLDTGATYSAISTQTMLRLGLQDAVATAGAPVSLETANGRVSAAAIRVGAIDLAGAIVEQVPVVVLDGLGDLDGLLGLSFLSHFDVEINQRDARLLLTPR